MRDKRFYSVKETAKILGVHYQTVYTLIREGHLSAVRVGKRKFGISDKELKRYITQRMI